MTLPACINPRVTHSRHEMERRCRTAANAVNVGNGDILCRVLEDFLVYVPGSDVSMTPHLVLSGLWEPWVALAVARSARDEWRFMDVGACFGYYALICAAVGGQGWAVEANRSACHYLARNLKINGASWVAAVNVAATSESFPGAVGVKVNRFEDDYAGANISFRVAAGDADPNLKAGRLDELVPEASGLDFLKIDVGGASYAALAGAQSLVRPGGVVLLEHHGSAFKNEYDALGGERRLLESLEADYHLYLVNYESDAKPAKVGAILSEPHTPLHLWLVKR